MPENIAKAEYLRMKYRYHNKSYKHRKSAIKPTAMFARYKGNSLRLWQNPNEGTITIGKGIFQGWKQIEREAERLDPQLAKLRKEHRKYANQVWQVATVPRQPDSVNLPVVVAG